uniref:Uncharacterized protein n=1 Tax=Oryza brachyantha TaxID=4533 RepID=J3M3H3_ORYBR
MPARLVERAGEHVVVVIHAARLVNPLLPSESLRRKDVLGLGGWARSVLLRLGCVVAEAVAEHADTAEPRGGLPVGREEGVVERRLAVGHVEKGGLVGAAAAPVVDVWHGEAQCRRRGALGCGEDGVEEFGVGGGFRGEEEVATEECGERELEAGGVGALEAADSEKRQPRGSEEGEAAAERRVRKEEAPVEAGGGDAGDGGAGAL